MIFRQATADDFEKITELSATLANTHVKKRPDIFKAAPKQTKRKFKKELKDNFFFYTVIENDGEITGLCKWKLFVTRDNEAFADLTSAMIYELIVSESYRRKGYGKQLFEKVAEIAKEKGADVVELDVWSFNENAQRFYESLGMTPQRTRLEKKI